MAPAMARNLQAGSLMCRGCLRTEIIRGASQRRWLGTKYVAKLMAAEDAWAVQAQEISAGKRKNLFDELDERGFIKDVLGTKDLLRETMRIKRISAYAGVDPTGPSLHLGHVLAFMPLFWMYLHGYGAYTLIGGSTAKIGDPTGRIDSRPDLSGAELIQNLTTIHHQVKALWVNVEKSAPRFGWKWEWAWRRGIFNNNHWWNKTSLLEVMKRLGAHVRVGPMLGRDNVKTRLSEGSGMSFAELAYPLMQGWDWYELFRQRGVQFQIGGSDQYGNILTGSECFKHCVKSEPDKALQLPSGKYDQPMGFTVPLLTDASGAKFGKSAGNAIWLDPFLTTPYNLYGYLVRRSDDEVERLLKLFTFHSLDTIAELVKTHMQDPSKRVAQHLLAHEVVGLVHGKAVADQAREEHRSVYGAMKESSAGPIPQEISQYQNPPATKEGVHAGNRPRIDIKLPRHILDQSLARIMYACGLATSISDADRSIKNGGVYLSGAPGGGIKYQHGMTAGGLQFTPVKAWGPQENKKFLIDDKILLVRKGKHNLRCVELISDDEWKKLGWEYPGQPGSGAFRKVKKKLDAALETAKLKKEKYGELAENDKVDPVTREVDLSNFSRGKLNQIKKKADEGLVQKDPW